MAVNHYRDSKDSVEQFYALLGFWLGGVAYGIYCILFVLAVKITIQTRKSQATSSARVFPFATLLIFIVTTVYMGLNTSRVLYAFSPQWTDASNGQLPIYHLRDYTTSKSFATMILMGLLVWLGDAVAIYRCFIIWGSWWVVILPIALLVLSIVNSTIIDVAFKHPGFIPAEQTRSLIGIVFPVNIAQSCVTTGLIAFRIWCQYRISCAAGLRGHGRGIDLFTIIRIIVESAMIFTVQQIMLCISFYVGSPMQYVFNEVLVPSIGSVFALMTIRIYAGQQRPTSEIQLSHVYSGLSVPPKVAHNSLSDSRGAGQTRSRSATEGIVFFRSRSLVTEQGYHPTLPLSRRTSQGADVEKGAYMVAQDTVESTKDT